MNVEINIDHLVIHELNVRDRRALRAAVEAELAHLFATRGVPPSLAQGGYRPEVNAGAIHLPDGGRGEATGAEVARAVYGGLNR